MKHSTPWIPLGSFHFADAVLDDASKAGRFRALPPPFLLPTRVRLLATESWTDFSIEFDYVTEERIVSGNFSENLKIFFGPRSMRVRKLVWTRTDIRDAATLHRMVSVALDKFAKVNYGRLPQENEMIAMHCKAIRNAMRSAANILIQQLRDLRETS